MDLDRRIGIVCGVKCVYVELIFSSVFMDEGKFSFLETEYPLRSKSLLERTHLKRRTFDSNEIAKRLPPFGRPTQYVKTKATPASSC